ncbi:MAG: type VI secretion system baseplate subunit TssE [Gemmatimonadales bacterium]|nr:MAG: type VI secretion system baseplate subunit TssE [Gemmatimonadales bacterium]
MAADRTRTRTVTRSIIDRLIDDSPRERADPEMGWEESVARHRQSVMRDLEWLLNTRRSPDPGELDGFPELRRSLMTYGPPDISSMSADTAVTRRRLLRQLEELIRTFEPRLSGARVRLEESSGSGARQVRFVVEGLLRMDPDPERVTFDTVLEIASGRFVVGGTSNA